MQPTAVVEGDVVVEKRGGQEQAVAGESGALALASDDPSNGAQKQKHTSSEVLTEEEELPRWRDHTPWPQRRTLWPSPSDDGPVSTGGFLRTVISSVWLPPALLPFLPSSHSPGNTVAFTRQNQQPHALARC
ncbi:Uncharacterized protein TSPI_03923 [Trichinella spiralis]|uniref:Uncharacterized protein n=1 Tax=Trichinella spiralis TaxID=6334 RepID=A0ABR3KDT1_TRISP